MSLPFDTSLEGKKIFLRVGATDFRRGVRGMVSLVVGAMNMSMDEQSMFVFCSTNRKQMRIVYCEGAGCWMLVQVHPVWLLLLAHGQELCGTDDGGTAEGFAVGPRSAGTAQGARPGDPDGPAHLRKIM